MNFFIYKDMKRIKRIVKRLFCRNRFDFDRENSIDYALFHENGFHAKTEEIKKIIRKHIKRETESLIMLDVGCGIGEIDRAISKDFEKFKIIGVDSASKSIREALDKDVNNNKFLVCNAEKLCFNNNSFNAVLLVNILHHSFANINLIIREAIRVMKKEGILIIFELNPLNLFQMIWFYLLCPIDRDMHMVNPLCLKRIIERITCRDGIVQYKLLWQVLYFEYVLVFSKKGR